MAEQLHPHDLWRWFDKYHWKHWHGIWVRWEPQTSLEVNISYRSVRSFQAVNLERTGVKHENQWYDPEGTGEAPKWMSGPWIITEEEHCLPNGIAHPALPTARTLVFPNGDAATLPVEVNRESPSLVSSEVHFVAPDGSARSAVIVRYNKEGILGSVSLIPEEALESAERTGDGWSGNIWKHELVRVPLELNREEPSGKFEGTETVLTSTLSLETREQVAWKGFRSGLEEEDSPDDYSLIHLPYQFTVCFLKKYVEGKAFSWVAHRVMNRNEVKTISWRYSAEGKFMQIKSAHYKKC